MVSSVAIILSFPSCLVEHQLDVPAQMFDARFGDGCAALRPGQYESSLKNRLRMKDEALRRPSNLQAALSIASAISASSVSSCILLELDGIVPISESIARQYGTV